MGYLSQHFVEILLSGMTLAFGLWAWAVKSGLSKGLEVLSTINERLIKLVENHNSLSTSFEKHSSLRWHREAGDEIARLQARMENMERHKQ